MKFHYFVNIIHQFLPKTIKQFNKSMNLLLFNKTWQSFCDQLVSILKNNSMDRKEFLTAIGFGTAGVLIASCMGGCKKEAVSPAPTGVNLTVKLSDYPDLINVGGMGTLPNGILVAYAVSGSYIAVWPHCTHQNGIVSYHKIPEGFSCPLHGARFSDTGANISGPAPSPLTQYTVTPNTAGTTLTITSM